MGVKREEVTSLLLGVVGGKKPPALFAEVLGSSESAV